LPLKRPSLPQHPLLRQGAFTRRRINLRHPPSIVSATPGIRCQARNNAIYARIFTAIDKKSLADDCPAEFNLYRVFDFAAAPRIFTLRPPLEDAVRLQAETWRAAFG